MDDYEAVYGYLSVGEYPTGFTKNQRRVLRGRCYANFKLEAGVLSYSANSRKPSANQVVREWKMAIQSNKEKQRILQSCHAEPHCESFGRE